jgi:hypothetical protein
MDTEGMRRDEPALDAPVAASLERGDRVVMSELGRQRHPRYGFRQGTIVGYGSPNSRRVKFDDSKTVQSIHVGYLKLLRPKRAAASAAHTITRSPAGTPNKDRASPSPR